MSGDLVTTLREFGKYLDMVNRVYPYNEDMINRLEAETQDILHEIELGTHSHHEHARLSKELERVRRERRRCKEENEAMKPLVEYVASSNIRQQLAKVQGLIDATVKRQESRQYTPRVRGK